MRPPVTAIIGSVLLYAIALATCGIAWDLRMPWLWVVTVIAGIWASVLLSVKDIPVIVMEDYSGEPPDQADQWTDDDWAQVEALLIRANTHRNPGKDS